MASEPPGGCRCGFDGACVGSPGSQYRSLFVEGEIGIIDHLLGMLEGLRRMQQLVEIEVEGFLCRGDRMVRAFHSHILD